MARKLLQQGLDCRIFILEYDARAGSQRFAFVTRDRWWMTAFLSALNIDTGFRAFDLFLLDGVPALFRLGLALLQVQFETANAPNHRSSTPPPSTPHIQLPTLNPPTRNP